MARTMDDAQGRAFVRGGTRPGKLATTRHDGRPHVVPIWFVLDGTDFVFNTGEHTIKGRALQRLGIAALCVDDERPPYAFVSVTGTVSISREPDELLRWATAIGGRYMGADRAQEVGGGHAGARPPPRRPRRPAQWPSCPCRSRRRRPRRPPAGRPSPARAAGRGTSPRAWSARRRGRRGT